MKVGPRGAALKRRFYPKTPFEKGKTAERPRRKATGLEHGVDTPTTPTESAGLPKEEKRRTIRSIEFQRGVPQNGPPLLSPRPGSHECDPGLAFFRQECGRSSRAMSEMKFLITEIFHSIQGESSLAGLPFAFIRLTGCDLRCTYCDTTYAFKGGEQKTIEEILRAIESYGTKHVLLTGGEPLIQKNIVPLIQALCAKNYDVSIETHGETSIEKAAPLARIIMDIKTPSSGMSRGGWKDNLKWLKPTDEIKFVIGSEADYEWAKNIVQTEKLPTREILFSPVIPIVGSNVGLEPKWLAESILRDRLPVRFQIQLHKIVWGPTQRGV